MPTVGELKERARALEKDGDWAKALAVYQHVLDHLEQAPDALAKELALYVKVGDLRLRLRQPARAVESYERAAEHYARLGSGQRVTGLCTKIVRVVPADAKAFARYARKLLEHGFVGSARDVLGEYADLANLQEAASALDDLAGRPDEEIRPLLLGLLDSIERDRPDQTEHAAVRVSSQLTEATEALAGDVPAIGDEDLPTTPPEVRGWGSRPGSASGEEVSRGSTGSEARAVRPEAARSRSPVGFGGRSLVGLDRAPVPALAAAFIVGLLGGVGLGLVGLVPTGGQSDGESPASAIREPQVNEISEPMAETEPESPESSVVVVDEPTPPVRQAAVSDVATAAPPPPARETAAAEPVREVPIVSVPEAPVAPSVPDSLPAIPDTAFADLGIITDTPAPDSASGVRQPIVVDGLAVQSVTEIEFRGQTGFRVVHLLDSGLPFTVESFPTDGDTTGLSRLGRVTVNLTPPDTLVGVLRMERYMVYASGVLPEDSLRALMGLLRERRPSN